MIKTIYVALILFSIVLCGIAVPATGGGLTKVSVAPQPPYSSSYTIIFANKS